MNDRHDLTTGNIKTKMLQFVLPYLLACFLQTFYGLADLFVVGLYDEAATSTAVAIGSQIMHMLTVMIVGLAMGTTVELAHAIGARNMQRAGRVIGNSCIFFAGLAIIGTAIASCFTAQLTAIMSTPPQAVEETKAYLQICFAGLPFIIAYNFICGIYRGAGDSSSPMIFVAVACVVNIIIDFLFIGMFDMGAAGAAFGTIIGQAVSVVFSLLFLKRAHLGFTLKRTDLQIAGPDLQAVLKVGFPICMQDGLIQIAFIVITIFANGRGLIDSTAVGVVEKLISFMFLVPSAFLSAISAVTAQNMGAEKPDRARSCLYFGLTVTVCWGLLCCVYCQFLPQTLIQIFRREPEIVSAGCSYLRSYSIDCIVAAVHFCFSGYFCGCQKSGISFIHNILSVVLVRIPGSYFACRCFADTLYPMGLAAPAGSFLSVLICLGFYYFLFIRNSRTEVGKQ